MSRVNLQASAISLTDSASTSVKTFDLMHQINNRGTYLVSKVSFRVHA